MNKLKLFNCEELINEMIGILRQVSNDYQFDVWAFCFMPDHVHLLVEGKSVNSDLKRFISMYKQKTGFYYRQRFGQSLWQINYNEHVLRKEETTDTVARYIFNNPGRKELAKDFYEYPYSGSFMFDFRKLQP